LIFSAGLHMSVSLEDEFDLSSKRVEPTTTFRILHFVEQIVFSFRFFRVSIWFVLVFIWAILFYGIENNYNPVYAIGQNITAQGFCLLFIYSCSFIFSLFCKANYTTSAPATGVPSSLQFVDALFVAVSFWSSTGNFLPFSGGFERRFLFFPFFLCVFCFVVLLFFVFFNFVVVVIIISIIIIILVL
jgi:hypothetical protein